MQLSRLIMLLILLALMNGTSAAQKHFFFDGPEDFRQPAKLPDATHAFLAGELARIPGCDEKPSTETPSFRAWRINLGAKRRALIVRVYEDCSHSADGFWFWIVLKNRSGYRSLLRAGSVSLTVRRVRTHGFPDIETNSATGQFNYKNIYKFNGTVYKVNRCTHTAFDTGKTEPVPCRKQ